jgi:chaperonin GroEL
VPPSTNCGTVISEERGYTLENMTLEMLGITQKVTIDKDNTTIAEWSW